MIRPSTLFVAVATLALSAACDLGTSAAPELTPPPSDPGLTQPLTLSASPSATPEAALSTVARVKPMLWQSAVRHGVNPYLVMGLAWWESGWDQSKVSATGAVGIMQVEPATAASAGPLLLHRAADVNDPADNIELGTAVLKEDLDRFDNDLAKSLIAYYAGPNAVRDWQNEDPATQHYVWGVYKLAVAFSNGTGPA